SNNIYGLKRLVACILNYCNIVKLLFHLEKQKAMWCSMNKFSKSRFYTSSISIKLLKIIKLCRGKYLLNLCLHITQVSSVWTVDLVVLGLLQLINQMMSEEYFQVIVFGLLHMFPLHESLLTVKYLNPHLITDFCLKEIILFGHKNLLLFIDIRYKPNSVNFLSPSVSPDTLYWPCLIRKISGLSESTGFTKLLGCRLENLYVDKHIQTYLYMIKEKECERTYKSKILINKYTYSEQNINLTMQSYLIVVVTPTALRTLFGRSAIDASTCRSSSTFNASSSIDNNEGEISGFLYSSNLCSSVSKFNVIKFSFLLVLITPLMQPLLTDESLLLDLTQCLFVDLSIHPL
ncbi:hypothetical protein AGLY_007480, partial [Aphis glycines]